MLDTALANLDFTLVHKYYLNRVSLSQDYMYTFKVLLCCFSVKCKQIWLRVFKWATVLHHRSRGCKTVKVGCPQKLSYPPLVYLVKWGFSCTGVKSFLNFQLWKVTVLQYLDLWWWMVAHLKTLSHICLHFTEKLHRNTLKVSNLGSKRLYLCSK